MKSRCVILCNGPSLSGLALRKIDCTTIGINLSYHARQADIHVFTHGNLIKTEGSKLAEATPEVRYRFSAATDPPSPIPGCFTPKKIQPQNVMSYREEEVVAELPGDYDVYRDGWIFCGGGPCALQIAVHFKFDEIVFCGLDLHTVGGHSNLGAKIQIDFFRQFLPQLASRGIVVYNTSMDSAEDVFEKRPFNSFWS